MALPRDIVLVRHGQSEANVIQKQIKADEGFEPPEAFFDRHDSQMQLTPLGIEQAQAAGGWLAQHFPNNFDHHWVSSLTRTVQTAGHLALHGDWRIEDLLRERDWGEFGMQSGEQQRTQYESSYRLREQNKWYWCPAGGESLGTGVRLRWERILNTMHRQMEGQTFIGVTHGETIEVGRVILERLLIPEWLSQEKDEGYKLSNAQILHYSRVNPVTGELGRQIEWRRSICPWDESKSWANGEWVRLDVNRRFSDEQLLAMAAIHEPLLGDTTS